LLPPGCPFFNIYRVKPIHEPPDFINPVVGRINGNQGASAAYPFGIRFSVCFVNTHLCQRPYQATRDGPEASTGQGSDQWASRQHGANTWNR
jgi:hypothetical protein